ncbi:MAG: DUF5666 domain-containing protein [Candidatus Sulfotelmatobacter sp.]
MVPSQNVVSSSGTTPASSEAIQPLEDTSETALDPASLLPDLPSLPPAKASLIGGTIQKLDRVRNEITVQVFGGGKMKIFFDTRTHIYQGPDQGSTSDLRQGDRVYVDTILDGSAVFAKTIRLKTTASAGESQGIVTSYRSDKGELQIRDVLSPRPLKIRLTPQTHIVHGDRAASAGELVSGTLVSVKFGSQQDGRDVAREVSVLAVPGASFTFAGRITGLDLRLGLLVLTSSTDNKSYEIYFDPAVIPADDSLRQAADVTVLTRFEGNRYVARSLTVNSQNQQ